MSTIAENVHYRSAESAQSTDVRRLAIASAVAIFAAAMAFALYTNLAWDDWYITYRASKNLALGNGLTFTVGERVHSFTSPDGTLIPAFLSYIIGNRNDDVVLWLFRIFNATVLAAAGALLVTLLARLQIRTWAIAALIAMAFLDAKTLANTINGMETAMLIFFTVLTLWVMFGRATVQSALLLGVSWSGLMWTRPDGIVYIAAFSLAFLIFSVDGVVGRRALIKQFVIAGLTTMVLYGPWLIWAHWYYGSFVPHTIVAKGLSKQNLSDTLSPRKFLRFLSSTTPNWEAIFMPPYSTLFGGWPRILIYSGRLIAWLSAFAWLVPWIRREVRTISLTAFILQLYLAMGMEYAFPWYYPPVALLSFCVIAMTLDQAAAANYGRPRSERPKWRYALPRYASAAIVIFVATTTVMGAVQLRFFEKTIYEGNYKLVGLWLRDHAKTPHDTVFLEPLGYIGFFSNLKMYDYPGLSSEEMIDARKHFPIRSLGDRAIFADLIPYMKPQWLVLRPLEIDLINAKRPDLLKNEYREVKTFDVAQEVDDAHLIPGRPWLRLDQTFVVYERADS